MTELYESKKNRSLLTMISFSVSDLHLAFFSFALGQYLLLFYETEVNLGIWYVTLGYIIYAVWNAVNDPLIGFITDQPRSYWQKWGKRFPLIIMASIPFVFSMAFVFTPPMWDPATQPLFYLLWFVFSACFFDTFFSILQTSHLALYPELFRSDSDRRNSGFWMMAMGLVGTAFGALVPGFFVIYYNRGSYSIMGWVLGIIGLIFFILYIYGHKEPESLRSRYLKKQDKEEDSFIIILRTMLKQKNFRVFLLIFFLDSIIGASLTASISYIVKYDLEMEAFMASVVLAGFILGSLGSMVPWLLYSQRLQNNRKMLIIGVFLNTIFLLPFMFTWDLLTLLIAAFILGIGGGALRIGRNPVMADVVDEAVVKSGKRLEGSLMGVYTFFNRLALIAQGLIFAIVHELTQFDPTVNPLDPVNPTHQTALALFGIRIHTAFIPMVLCLLGLIVFYKVYNLTPEKTLEIKEQLKKAAL
jgi:GPH family glycoside/pentoside/hexuronide:cation symporter